MRSNSGIKSNAKDSFLHSKNEHKNSRKIMKNFAKRTDQLQESIFTTMSNKALKAKAINLAQGFPDFNGPDWLILAAQNILKDNVLANQYSPSSGNPQLRRAIAQQQSQDWGANFDPESEITITVGATEAIYVSLQSLVDPHEEVIVFEPLYDSYAATIEMIGAVARPVTLKLPDFNFNQEELKAAFNSKTKAIILNSPHNPCGKLFQREELDMIASLAKKYDAWIITDEVYEYLTFEQDHQEFVKWRSSENIRQRCIAISSAGKTFGMTGWKIGWVMAPSEVTRVIRMVHQYIPFCASHPLQMAVAHGLEHRARYITQFKQDYLRKRNLLANGLKELGHHVLLPTGTYFLQILIKKNAFEFCDHLVTHHGVAAIATSPFYLKDQQGEHLVRLCFAKKDETIRSALQRLKGSAL